MNRLVGVLPSVFFLMVLWQECGENPLLFCYRMGVGAFVTVRSRALVPVRVGGAGWRRPLRNQLACSNPYATCCTRSTTLKD
jgi:hypothetical protein